MFKVGTSLVLAVIAALVVFLAALVGGARIGTVFLRSLIAFLMTGALAWLVLFLLEAKGIAVFDRSLEFPEESAEAAGEEESPAPSPEEAAAEEEAPEEQGTPSQPGASEQEEQASFQPLAAGGLKHVEAVPEGSQAAE